MCKNTFSLLEKGLNSDKDISVLVIPKNLSPFSGSQSLRDI